MMFMTKVIGKKTLSKPSNKILTFLIGIVLQCNMSHGAEKSYQIGECKDMDNGKSYYTISGVPGHEDHIRIVKVTCTDGFISAQIPMGMQAEGYPVQALKHSLERAIDDEMNFEIERSRDKTDALYSGRDARKDFSEFSKTSAAWVAPALPFISLLSPKVQWTTANIRGGVFGTIVALTPAIYGYFTLPVADWIAAKIKKKAINAGLAVNENYSAEYNSFIFERAVEILDNPKIQ